MSIIVGSDELIYTIIVMLWQRWAHGSNIVYINMGIIYFSKVIGPNELIYYRYEIYILVQMKKE